MRLSGDVVLGGRYQLVRPLGAGGMGEVWSATNLVTGRAVAIKRLILSPHQYEPEEAQARFLLEARSACAVAHPNVVEVLDFVEAPDELPFIVMELLQGETLAQKLSRERALTLQETASVALPVASAVGSAHARGMVHRDLKPANIFCSTGHGARPVVKVLDFGIAKWLASDLAPSDVRTQTGSTLGTPSYMAPEQAMAARSVDHRADIWSLGVILYECLSGVRPVEGDNPAQVVVRLISSGIIPVERLVPELPRELTQLIGRMLTREPSKRPRDLGEVFAVLRAYTDVEALDFSAPHADLFRSELERVVCAAEDSAALVTGLPVTGPPERRRPGRGATLAGLLALLGAVGLLLLWPQRSTETPPAPPRSAAPPSVAVVLSERTQVPAEPQASAPEATPAPSAPAAPSVAQPAPSVAPARRRQTVARKTRNVSAPADGKRAPAPGGTAPGKFMEPTPPDPLPRGATCDRSAVCASRLCVAFRCR